MPMLVAEGGQAGQHPFQAAVVLLVVNLVDGPFKPQLLELAGSIGFDLTLPGQFTLVDDPSSEGRVRFPAGGDTGVPLLGHEGLEFPEAKVPPFVVPARKALPLLSSLRRGMGHACRERIPELPPVCPVR